MNNAVDAYASTVMTIQMVIYTLQSIFKKKTDKQYIAKDIIYAFADDRVTNAAFIYDEPLLTIASNLNHLCNSD